MDMDMDNTINADVIVILLTLTYSSQYKYFLSWLILHISTSGISSRDGLSRKTQSSEEAKSYCSFRSSSFKRKSFSASICLANARRTCSTHKKYV